MNKLLLALLLSSLLSACTCFDSSSGDGLSIVNDTQLNKIVNERTEKDRARDQYRHPKQTLAFFAIEPNMTVVEVLPGGGWYSKILAPYLAKSGALYGINYADDMWPMFGFFSAEAIVKKQQSMNSFADQVASWGGNALRSQGFAFGRVPEEINGTVDSVLMIRALHHLNRFEDNAATRSNALKDVYGMLKPGGTVGLVQHRAPESSTDEWAVGNAGYLKQSAVIQAFEAAGFKLVASSEINANAKDQPTANDIVWRLLPSLRTSKDDQVKREEMIAIGESDRMTLKFQKPKN